MEQSYYFRQINFFPWFKRKGYRQWHSYQRLWQTRWLRISYRQFSLVEWWCSKTPIVRCLHFSFARCCTGVLDFHSKNLQITSKLLTRGYRYNTLRITFGNLYRSYSRLLSKFHKISLQEYISEGIALPVFYGDIVYKLRRVKDTANFVSSGSKIVERLWRRKYNPVIIGRTKGLVLGPSTALYWSFLKHCTLTNKAMGTIWREFSKHPQRRQGPDHSPLWLLVGLRRPLDLSSFSDDQSTVYSGGFLIFLCTIFIGLHVCVSIFMICPLWLAVVPRSVFIRRIIYNFLNGCTFDYTAFEICGKIGTPSTLRPELVSRRTEHSLLWHISYTLYVLFYRLTCLCKDFMVSPLWLAVGPRSL